MADSINSAWTTYESQAGTGASGSGFRTWLNSNAGDTTARGYVDGLSKVYQDLGRTGLTPAEINTSRTTTMNRLLSSGASGGTMTGAQLGNAIGN
jgi:hypothetical protein